MRKIVFIVITIGCILGYGYWHSLTHAAFYVQLDFKDDDNETLKNTTRVEVDFLDAEGRLLAHGVSDDQYNYVHLIHPEVGDCHAVERSATVSESGRNAWQVCFEQLSSWIALWAGKVRQVNVKTDRCTWRNRLVTVSKSRKDWFLWWVPHPHIGGKPYTYYSLHVVVDNDKCNYQASSLLSVACA